MLQLLFVWTLLTTPSDRLICSMWINRPVDLRAIRQSGCVFDEEQAAPIDVFLVEAQANQQKRRIMKELNLPKPSKMVLPVKVNYFWVAVGMFSPIIFLIICLVILWITS